MGEIIFKATKRHDFRTHIANHINIPSAITLHKEWFVGFLGKTGFFLGCPQFFLC